MRDLAAAQPDRVQAMAAQWDAWAARAHVLPLGAWKVGNARMNQQKNAGRAAKPGAGKPKKKRQPEP